jgi:hypothetical protein
MTVALLDSHTAILASNEHHHRLKISFSRASLPKYAACAIWQNNPTSTTPVSILTCV